MRTAIRRVWWVLLLVAATTALLVGTAGGTAGAGSKTQVSLPFGSSTTVARTTTTAPTTTSPVTSATTTTVPSGSSLQASLVPCGTASGPCDVEPSQIEVGFAGGSPPSAVQMVWTPTPGRPEDAPSPDSTSVVLSMSDTTSCNQPGGAAAGGQTTDCWDWPGGLRYRSDWILNGTYQVQSCESGQTSPCSQASGGQPLLVQLAVPPPPPGGVRSSVSGQTVTVSWQPPPQPPPDLAGYLVLRDGQPIYSCTLFDFGPQGNVPCPSTLATSDKPGGGKWSYQVESVRLGAGGQAPAVLASAPSSAGPVSVAGPAGKASATGSGATGSGAAPVLPPVPVVGAFAGLSPATGSAGEAPSDLALPGESEGASGNGPVQNLTYPSSGLSAKSAHSDGTEKIGASGPDVVPLGMVAAAVLILAIAFHLLYLRGLVDAKRLRDGKVG